MLQVVFNREFLKCILNSIRYSEPPNAYGVEVKRYDIQRFLQEYVVQMIGNLNIMHLQRRFFHLKHLQSG